jgi:hypothetical protein
VFRGAWQAGDALTYEFALDAPDGPASYAGTVMSVEWVLRATVDLPWAADPTVEEVITVAAGANLGPSFEKPAPPAPESLLGLGCVVLVGLVFAGPGAVIAIGSIAEVAQGRLSSSCGGALGFVFAAMGVIIIYFGIRNRLAQGTLGRVIVRIEPQDVRRGGTLGVRVSFTPRRAAPVNSLTVKLEAQESATKGGGKSRNTKTHKVFERAVTRLAGETLVPRRPMNLDATFDVPADAPPTFMAPSNELKWTLDVHFDLPGRPDWNTTYPVVVRP